VFENENQIETDVNKYYICDNKGCQSYREENENCCFLYMHDITKCPQHVKLVQEDEENEQKK
jgi:hypothetical protein